MLVDKVLVLHPLVPERADDKLDLPENGKRCKVEAGHGHASLEEAPWHAWRAKQKRAGRLDKACNHDRLGQCGGVNSYRACHLILTLEHVLQPDDTLQAMLSLNTEYTKDISKDLQNTFI